MSLWYKVKFQQCPQCGQRLKVGVPRFGPETVKCGNCRAMIKTGLRPWASLSDFEQRFDWTLEMVAPSFVGTYASMAGFTFFVLNFALVIWPLVGVMMILGTFGFDLTNVAVGLALILGGLLYVRAYPLKHLLREIQISDAYSRTKVAPTWRVSGGREWLRVWWRYIVLPIVALMGVLLVALGMSFALA